MQNVSHSKHDHGTFMHVLNLVMLYNHPNNSCTNRTTNRHEHTLLTNANIWHIGEGCWVGSADQNIIFTLWNTSFCATCKLYSYLHDIPAAKITAYREVTHQEKAKQEFYYFFFICMLLIRILCVLKKLKIIYTKLIYNNV